MMISDVHLNAGCQSSRRALDQLDEKGIDVDNLDDEWGERLKEIKRKKEEEKMKDFNWEVRREQVLRH
jgi:Tfp pilus assembly pilus retraction ATPase PilT